VGLPEVCVVYLIRGRAGSDEVLLGRKRTGLGEGKIVAPGGKLEPGESPRQAAVREVLEEVGLSIREDDLELVGELQYPFPTREAWTQFSWAFVVRGEFAEPTPSTELDARWYPRDSIPLDRMWDDARYWLPAALNGIRVSATFEFGPDLSTVAWSDHPSFLARSPLVGD
jgi:8-oxo-dGTP diphosphatase